MEMETTDRVNHPNHYQFPGGVEVLDIARYLDFNCGNIIKYVARAGRKEELGMSSNQKRLEDLRKAFVYLQDEIRMLEQSTIL